jgi:hypothetical protein
VITGISLFRTRSRQEAIVRLFRLSAGAVALVALAVLVATGCGEEKSRPSQHRFFAPKSVWNRELPARAPIDPRSAQVVGELRRQVDAAGAWINTDQYSAPVYRVPRSQRRVPVKLDTPNPSLQRAMNAVPIPAGATPAAGSDKHLVVWQPSTDRMWEFWVARKESDGWRAGWGGRIRGVSKSAGSFRAPFGATATGLPLVGGLLRPDEVRRDDVRHALAFALPETRAGAFRPPATRTDGQVPKETAIPEGTRFRLDPDLDLDRLDLPRPTHAIAEAAQRYGMIVRDKAGAVTLYGEDPRTAGSWKSAFAGHSPDEIMRRFPWDRLQVVRAPIRQISK